MSIFTRSRRLAFLVARLAAWAIAMVLAAALVGAAALQTAWAKERLRALIVSQANRFLTATLDIGRLDGSLFGGIELRDVRLVSGDEPIVRIDRVLVAYSLREIIETGTVIRRLRVERPVVAAARQADGRWNLAALIRRASDQPRGPAPAIRFDRIEVMDATVTVAEPLAFGAARVPTRYEHLNAALAFENGRDGWSLLFEHASWTGTAPELSVTSLSGGISVGPDGIAFSDLHVETARSDFVLSGRIDRAQAPTVLDLHVNADRFGFQEWAGVVRGLRSIAVDSSFDVRLEGPLAKLATQLTLASDGGDVSGRLVLDTTVPGWRAAGALDVARLDLARWLNRPDRPSDITGNVRFSLDLDLGGRFPRGTYAFAGRHAAYLGYEADDVRARGTITATEVLIASTTATAYGANLVLSAGSIGLASPFPFRFQGIANGVDLRLVPPDVPVPHVESTLAFDYDVSGRFVTPFIAGRAVFDDSEFLGAAIGAGTVGGIDTLARPFRYNGEGDLRGLSLRRFGEDLGIGWLQEPRYDGTVAGRFRVEGTGSDPATMTLRGGGRLDRVDLFQGELSDADVDITIRDGTLQASYDGEFSAIDPGVAFDDPRLTASISGSGRADITVRDLLTATPALSAYEVSAKVSLTGSHARGIPVRSGTLSARLAGGTLDIEAIRLEGPELDATGSGRLELDGLRSSSFEYELASVDLIVLRDLAGRDVAGTLATSGRLTGPLSAISLQGGLRLHDVGVGGLQAAEVTGDYDMTIPSDDPAQATGRVAVAAGPVEVFGQTLTSVAGPATYFAGRVTTELQVIVRDGLDGGVEAAFTLDIDGRTASLETLSVRLRDTEWRLDPPPGRTASVSWDQAGVGVDALRLAQADDPSQQMAAGGTWRTDGTGVMRLSLTSVSLDRLLATGDAPSEYGGRVTIDAALRGTPDVPVVTAMVTIADGRLRRLAYERLGGRVDYSAEVFGVDLRFDQAPGVWLTATGSVPLALFDRSRPEQPLNVRLRSSPISLGLIEAVSDVVREVTGVMELDVQAVGTSHDPHFDGTVAVSDAAFVVSATGARYRNGTAAVQLARDRVTVSALHLEDSAGRLLEARGSLGTNELRAGDLDLDVSARQFAVLRNEFGTLDVDASVNVRGRFDSPRLTGTLTVTGGELRVDTILEGALFRPYATEAQTSGPIELDPLRVLNPWERLGLDLELRVPGTLRMAGENLQVATGTPLGVSNINLRVTGALYLYKDPAQPLYVTGSLDRLAGAFAFQGRAFDLDPNSSVNFRGDLSPEVYVMVQREISGVDTRVTIAGSMAEPELRLSSIPPLEPSDILSLIVFNTSTNELSAAQQQQLAVRGVTLAAGFLASPLVSALERSLGLDVLEIEPGGVTGGTRVTIGDEIAPGLVARFSRQFGQDQYDQATLEYYLSRIFRVRATFSDAGTLGTRSPFRRIERAGIDLLLFFSF
jgi:autotransporter translocation and assembly factor TamB